MHYALTHMSCPASWHESDFPASIIERWWTTVMSINNHDNPRRRASPSTFVQNTDVIITIADAILDTYRQNLPLAPLRHRWGKPAIDAAEMFLMRMGYLNGQGEMVF